MRSLVLCGVIVSFLPACSDADTGAGSTESSEPSGGDGDGDLATGGDIVDSTGGAGEPPASGGSATGGLTGTGGGLGTGGAGATGGNVGTGGEMATGGETATGGADGTGGAVELVLEGEPPGRLDLAATAVNFTILPDTDEFTAYSDTAPFEILPIESQNFPPGFDHCTAPGGDPDLNANQQWARAELNADLKTWYYDVTLISVPEEDGETPYQLLVDGEVVREFTTPATGTMGAENLVDYPHTWESVAIMAGQSVEIRSKAHSNLQITEGGTCREYSPTYAWARGRWNGLILEAAATE